MKTDLTTFPNLAGAGSVHGLVVGVDIGGTNLRLALADPSGNILARWSASTVGVRAPEIVVELIHNGVANVLEQAGVSRSLLRAIAVGAPGITNVETGVVIATSYLLGWRDVPLRNLLEESLGIPAAVENDVNLATLGESWTGAAQGYSDFVFIAIGTGLGAGIFLGGRPFHSKDWTAGEIGYMLLPGLPGQPAERGKPGALEEILGGGGIKAQWQSRWSQDATTLPSSLHATEVFDHALLGDALAHSILQQSAHMLASVIYNIALVLNCPLFVLGGGVGSHPVLHEAAQQILIDWNTRVQPQLARSRLGSDAQLIGAIRLALHTANDAANAFATYGRLE
ncbi:ROK family protein [Edaphobacter bradus]|uniref:ROK family protein n=1 Tax=Edaphobacter bradus TaxID=2259016 RepID=UPI0021DFC9D4|nr:ROK family protein [Edaphobacter bradus]